MYLGLRSQPIRSLMLAISLIAITGFIVFLISTNAKLRLAVSLADEQTKVFEDMLVTRRGQEQDLRDRIEYINTYYPSGSKQLQGSRLDRIVERSRKMAIMILSRDLPEVEKQ